MLRQVCADTLHPQFKRHRGTSGGKLWHSDGAISTTFELFSVLMTVAFLRMCVCLCCKHVNTFQPEQTWSGNACELFTCMKVNNTLELMSSQIVCPPFEESNCEPVSVVLRTFLCWNDRNLKCCFFLSLFSEYNSD